MACGVCARSTRRAAPLPGEGSTHLRGCGMTAVGAKQPFVRKQPPPTLPNMGETAYSNSICVCTDRTTRSKAALASRPARLLWRPLSTALRPARPGPVRCILYRSERRSGAVDGVCEEACAERLCCVDRLSRQGLKSHPGHAIAKVQQAGFVAMLSFELVAALRPRAVSWKRSTSSLSQNRTESKP